ncbi:hypothetical protein L1887_32857 [Cichorium endivia]|nr:hypothetical protein L1887_32857 [Cichorium endivia]
MEFHLLTYSQPNITIHGNPRSYPSVPCTKNPSTVNSLLTIDSPSLRRTSHVSDTIASSSAACQWYVFTFTAFTHSRRSTSDEDLAESELSYCLV